MAMRIIAVLLLVFFGLQSEGVAALDSPDAAEQNVKALNHLNLSLYRIANYNNKAVLDEEYDTITNDLRLDAIGDKRLVAIIQELMDALTAFKISEQERSRMQSTYARMQEDLMLDMLRNGAKGISAGAVSGAAATGTPMGAAAGIIASVPNVAATVTKPMAELNLQKQKIADFEWGLDLEKLKSLNELNKKFLSTYWDFLHEAGVPDSLRISGKQIASLFDVNKDANPDTRYRTLVRLEKECGNIPAYWYYRADAAHDSLVKAEKGGDHAQRAALVADVETCLGQYRKIAGIFRKDGMLASLLMLHLATASLDPEQARAEIAELVQPYPLDASKRLFAALTCLRYGHKEEAIEHLNANLDMGQYETISRKLLADIYQQNQDEQKETELLEKLIGDDSASNQEIMYHLGKLAGYEKFMAELEPQLASIKLEIRPSMVGDDDIEIVLPPKWEFVENRDEPVLLRLGDRQLKSDSVEIDPEGQIRIIFKKAVKEADLAAHSSVPVMAEIPTRHFPIIIEGKLVFPDESRAEQGMLHKIRDTAKKFIPRSAASFNLGRISCEDVVFRHEDGKWRRLRS